MTNFELVTAADVRLMQGMAQRVTATRPDLVNSDATFGEPAWNWGKGHDGEGANWRRRLWFSGRELVAWGWAYLPHQVTRSDGSVKDVTAPRRRNDGVIDDHVARRSEQNGRVRAASALPAYGGWQRRCC